MECWLQRKSSPIRSRAASSFTHMRAFFNTVSVVTIQEPDYFAYQDVLFIEDMMLNLMQIAKEGRRPPLVFFTTAWATILQTWSDETRTSGKSLAVLVRETASWAPQLTAWTPTSTGSSSRTDSSSIVPSTGAGSAKERELQAELDKARKWASEMQSQRDRARHSANTAQHHEDDRSRSRQQDNNAGSRGPRRNAGYPNTAPKSKGRGKKWR